MHSLATSYGMDKLPLWLRKIGWPVLIALGFVVVFVVVIVLIWGIRGVTPYPMMNSLSDYDLSGQGMMGRESGAPTFSIFNKNLQNNSSLNPKSSTEGALTQRKIIKNG